jgi:hypothetical protein
VIMGKHVEEVQIPSFKKTACDSNVKLILAR